MCLCLCCPVPKCPIGMKYSECTKSCSTTCHSLNIQEVCKEDCVDGCTCPGIYPLATLPSSSTRPSVGCSCDICVFQWGKFWTAVAVWRFLSVPACTWGDVSLQDRPLLKTATHGEKAEIYWIHCAPPLNNCVVFMQRLPSRFLGMYQWRLPWWETCTVLLPNSVIPFAKFGMLIFGVLSL